MLAARHTRDMFFAEVKNGPTQGTTHLRLDALAIAKSWSPIRLMAYEVMVSRADWLQDRKWEAYIPLAHHFSIVCEVGVVKLEELPPSVGLLEVSSTGQSLKWIQRPVYRDIHLPARLLLYLLMSRTIGDPHRPRERTREERMAYWREVLAEGKSIDYLVKDKIRTRIRNAERAGGRADELGELEEWLLSEGADRWGTTRPRTCCGPRARQPRSCYPLGRRSRRYPISLPLMPAAPIAM
jgi:hypothetical protein